MTEADLAALNRRLAEKVMGWREYIWDDGYGGCPAWQDKNGWHCGFVKSNHYPNPWNPTQDIEQAMMVAVKIGRFELYDYRYDRKEWENGESDWCAVFHGLSEYSITPELAICLAADAWLRQEEK